MAVGDEVLIIAVGSMVYPALAVRDILKAKGISSTVINARFIKPLDNELISDAVQKHRCCVTMEENVLAGGFGSAVLELLAQNGIEGVKCLNIGLPDEFITHGPVEVLKDLLELTPEKMADKIVSRFELKGKKTKTITLNFNKR